MRNAVKVGARVYLRPVEVGDARRFADGSHLEGETQF